MDSAMLAGRMLLALVFATAAAGKLLSLDGSQRTLADFGVPVRFTKPGAVLLPFAELGIAIALVSRSTARFGAAAAVVLLFVFQVGIVNALAHRRAPECHCFGRIQSRPVGKGILARNSALILAASILVWSGPGPAIAAWVTEHTTSELLVSSIAVTLTTIAAFSVRGLLQRRSAGRERTRPASEEQPGVEAGSIAPSFELRGACGQARTLASLCERDRPIVLIFTDPLCSPCQELFPHIARWQGALARHLTVAVIAQGAITHNRLVCAQHGIIDFMVDENSTIFNAYRMPGTPSAVVVGSDGTIASGTANGALMIEALIRLAQRRSDRSGASARRPVIRN